MNKSTLYQLILLLLFFLTGLVAFNLLLFVVALFHGHSFEQLMSHPDLIIKSFKGQQLLVIQLLSHVFSLIIPAFLMTRFVPDIRNHLTTGLLKSQTLWKTVIFFICLLPLVSWSAQLNQMIPLPEWMTKTESQLSDLIKDMLAMNSIGDFILALITIAIIPAISEEWIFRGIIQKMALNISPRKIYGIVLTAIIFSSFHMQFEGFLPRFFLGLGLGYVYYITGHLFYSMFLHFLFNGANVLMVYINGPETLDQLDHVPNSPLLWISGLISLFISLYLGYKMYTQKAIVNA